MAVGIQQRLLEGHGNVPAFGRIAKSHPRQHLLHLVHQGTDQAWVVVELELELVLHKAVGEVLIAAIGVGDGDDLLDRVEQLVGQLALGNVTGRPPVEGLQGQILAPLPRDEHDRNLRMLLPDSGH